MRNETRIWTICLRKVYRDLANYVDLSFYILKIRRRSKKMTKASINWRNSAISACPSQRCHSRRFLSAEKIFGKKKWKYTKVFVLIETRRGEKRRRETSVAMDVQKTLCVAETLIEQEHRSKLKLLNRTHWSSRESRSSSIEMDWGVCVLWDCQRTRFNLECCRHPRTCGIIAYSVATQHARSPG